MKILTATSPIAFAPIHLRTSGEHRSVIDLFPDDLGAEPVRCICLDCGVRWTEGGDRSPECRP